jgi:hypothetical protein
VHKTNINGNTVPPGALISFVQKGLQYLELEANLNEEGDVADGEFAPLTPHEMLTLDGDELKGVVRERREQQPEQRERLGKAKADRDSRDADDARAESRHNKERDDNGVSAFPSLLCPPFASASLHTRGGRAARTAATHAAIDGRGRAAAVMTVRRAHGRRQLLGRVSPRD